MSHPNCRCSTEPAQPEPRKGYIDAGTARPHLERFRFDTTAMTSAELAEFQTIVNRARIMPGVTVWKAREHAPGRGFDVDIEVKNETPSITRVGAPRGHTATFTIADEAVTLMEKIRNMPYPITNPGAVFVFPRIGTGA